MVLGKTLHKLAADNRRNRPCAWHFSRALLRPSPFTASATAAMAEKKTIVASGYKQVGSRATPEAITKELRKLPSSAGPLDGRKRALHDLAHALAYVQESHKVIVCENCKGENAAGLLIQLLTDIDTAPPVPAGEDVIRVGRRVLGMGPMDARLYVLSCFVNLSYLGGAGQLRLPPDGLPYSGAPTRPSIHAPSALTHIPVLHAPSRPPPRLTSRRSPDDGSDGGALRHAPYHAGLRVGPLLCRRRPVQPFERRLFCPDGRPQAGRACQIALSQ